jgi:hypothetical protein
MASPVQALARTVVSPLQHFGRMFAVVKAVAEKRPTDAPAPVPAEPAQA